jgi:hypothetical protein
MDDRRISNTLLIQPLEGLDTVKTFIANRQAQAQAKRSETIASI